AGYAEALELISDSWEHLSLTENHIKQLHSVLLKFSEKDSRHRGKYKTLANNVVAYDADGREIGIVFQTASPFETPQEMERLVNWSRQQLADRSIHPLLAIGCFVVHFLAIHPFQDGNGRLSRILTILLLLRAGYAYVTYASLESVIEENKDTYYSALRRTQVTLKTKQAQWDPWLVFFLRCLKRQGDNLARKLEREKTLTGALPSLSVAILSLLKDHGRLTISDMERLTSANRNTLKVRLRELTKQEHIIRHGMARATWYTLKPGS
ncbi:MAG TPA: Fic family protein, partial [Blastocatellia bacterium]|nr:Fic family protein [Blastocatellia bacterium]